MAQFAKTGEFDVADDVLDKMLETFAAYRLDDAGTVAEIERSKASYNMVIDPHSAVGLYGARMARADGLVGSDVPIIALACAHPAKFPDAVEKGTGARPDLPPHLSDLMDREERFVVLDNDLGVVQAHLKEERRGQ